MSKGAWEGEGVKRLSQVGVCLNNNVPDNTGASQEGHNERRLAMPESPFSSLLMCQGDLRYGQCCSQCVRLVKAIWKKDLAMQWSSLKQS